MPCCITDSLRSRRQQRPWCAARPRITGARRTSRYCLARCSWPRQSEPVTRWCNSQDLQHRRPARTTSTVSPTSTPPPAGERTGGIEDGHRTGTACLTAAGAASNGEFPDPVTRQPDDEAMTTAGHPSVGQRRDRHVRFARKHRGTSTPDRARRTPRVTVDEGGGARPWPIRRAPRRRARADHHPCRGAALPEFSVCRTTWAPASWAGAAVSSVEAVVDDDDEVDAVDTAHRGRWPRSGRPVPAGMIAATPSAQRHLSENVCCGPDRSSGVGGSRGQRPRRTASPRRRARTRGRPARQQRRPRDGHEELPGPEGAEEARALAEVLAGGVGGRGRRSPGSLVITEDDADEGPVAEVHVVGRREAAGGSSARSTRWRARGARGRVVPSSPSTDQE